MMVEFDDIKGRRVCVPRDRIIAILEAGPSSKSHGIRSEVRVEGLGVIESRDDVQTIMGRCNGVVEGR